MDQLLSDAADGVKLLLFWFLVLPMSVDIMSKCVFRNFKDSRYDDDSTNTTTT